MSQETKTAPSSPEQPEPLYRFSGPLRRQPAYLLIPGPPVTAANVLFPVPTK